MDVTDPRVDKLDMAGSGVEEEIMGAEVELFGRDLGFLEGDCCLECLIENGENLGRGEVRRLLGPVSDLDVESGETLIENEIVLEDV